MPTEKEMGSENTNKLGGHCLEGDGELDLMEAEAKATSTQQGVCRLRMQFQSLTAVRFSPHLMYPTC